MNCNVFWIEEQGKFFYNPTGIATRMLGVCMDITSRQQALETQKLIYLIKSSSEFIGVATVDGQVIYLNEAGQKLVGIESLEEVTNTELIEYLTGDKTYFQEHILPGAIAQGHG